MRITSEILDKTIEMNEQTTKQVEAHIQYIEKRLIKWKSLPLEQQALEILKEYHLVEAPIPDEHWGGLFESLAMAVWFPSSIPHSPVCINISFIGMKYTI